MSEQQAETPVETPEENTPAWFRDQMSKKDAENAELQKQLNRQKVKLMGATFNEVGLDPTKGLGKAIAEKYDGEPDAEKLRAFAIEEYDWQPPATPEQEMNAAINEAQARVNQAQAGAESVNTSIIDTQIDEAESRGDFATAIALQVQRYRQQKGI